MSDTDKDVALYALASGAAMFLVLSGALWAATGLVRIIRGR